MSTRALLHGRMVGLGIVLLTIAFQGSPSAQQGADPSPRVGASDLALSMSAATAAAQAAVEALDPPLEQAMYVDPSRVRALHTAIKAITDPLKTELVTVLNLDLPKAAEGDND